MLVTETGQLLSVLKIYVYVLYLFPQNKSNKGKKGTVQLFSNKKNEKKKTRNESFCHICFSHEYDYCYLLRIRFRKGFSFIEIQIKSVMWLDYYVGSTVETTAVTFH